jgi:hypothetical protein
MIIAIFYHFFPDNLNQAGGWHLFIADLTDGFRKFQVFLAAGAEHATFEPKHWLREMTVGGGSGCGLGRVGNG